MLLLHFLPLLDLPGERNPCWKSSRKQMMPVAPRALNPRSLQGISADFLSPNIGIKSQILPSKDRSRLSLCPILLLWLHFVFQGRRGDGAVSPPETRRQVRYQLGTQGGCGCVHSWPSSMEPIIAFTPQFRLRNCILSILSSSRYRSERQISK